MILDKKINDMFTVKEKEIFIKLNKYDIDTINNKLVTFKEYDKSIIFSKLLDYNVDLLTDDLNTKMVKESNLQFLSMLALIGYFMVDREKLINIDDLDLEFVKKQLELTTLDNRTTKDIMYLYVAIMQNLIYLHNINFMIKLSVFSKLKSMELLLSDKMIKIDTIVNEKLKDFDISISYEKYLNIIHSIFQEIYELIKHDFKNIIIPSKNVIN